MAVIAAVERGRVRSLRSFVGARRRELPGVLALGAIAILELVSAQLFVALDAVNRYGLAALSDGRFEVGFNVGLAGLFLPFVVVAWLLGKPKVIRVLFRIAIAVALVDVVISVAMVVATINEHTGNVGAATLLANAAALWVLNVVIFAMWYWSADAGGPHVRGTAAARRPDFDFPQHRHAIRGWEDWVPGFIDYLYAAFVVSLTFHPAGTEVLSSRFKYINMLQALASVAILLILVARGIATFTPGS